MTKNILLPLTTLIILTGCGESPEPKMSSQDLKEQSVIKDKKSDKVDSKLDRATEVKKKPYENELVAGKNGDISNQTIVPIDGKHVEYTLPIVYFAFDKFEVTSEGMAKLEGFAQKIKDDKLTDKKISIGGHCDEWGADEYNIALGLKRAKATEKALKSLGLTSEMVLTSYGESKPVCMSHERKCWKLNRRSEVAILP